MPLPSSTAVSSAIVVMAPAIAIPVCIEVITSVSSLMLLTTECVCLLGRDEDSAWLYAVMMVYLDAIGSLETCYNYDCVIELMGKILIDQDVENQISHHMTSVSKRSSLLVSENFLEKRKFSE